MIFNTVFIALCVVCGALLYVQNQGGSTSLNTTPDFKKFQRVYLLVYLCAVMGDWLQ
eukprot:CAMPEP_0174936374 /NCGR_PEP_ID=MMETSP1355-20121228/57156_1 /TAXON_ID=464990 /ORGANISM="Hemiselmis tepida, Strain CCMP443" /LENGTH=56 /DNA_ID=CAMNT_0016183143 /DNA_START=23 /DNA_END=190 /DNA_ORIENTATION=-